MVKYSVHFEAIGWRPIEASSGIAMVRRPEMEDISAIIYSGFFLQCTGGARSSCLDVRNFLRG